MLLTGRQIVSLDDFSDGADCRVSKLAGDNSVWVKAVRIDKVVVWIDPWGQIMDVPPGKEAPRER